MQQTSKYQFNLIETGDTFSPDPLNQNMEKVESALDAARAESAASVSGESASRAAGDAALNQRVQVLEARKIVAGYVEGAGTVNLGFTPIAVMAQGSGGGGTGIGLSTVGHGGGVTIVEGGFIHGGYLTNCAYVAFA